jgi:predicted PurR-regulated permease PerM
MSDWTFFRRVLIAGAVVVLVLLVWRLADALLLLFGAVLIGLLLSGATDAICRYTGLPRLLALTLVVLAVVGVFVSVTLAFGTQITMQLVDLWQRLPGAIDNFEQRLGLGDISAQILEQLRSNTGNILFEITSWAAVLLNLAGNAALLLVSAVFLAGEPSLYRSGALKLVPPSQRPPIEETLDFSAAALRQWLVGQLIAVAIVGTIMGIGASFIGLPAPLALGLIAGLLEFIPFAGPIIGAVPAILLALTQSWTHVMLTAGLIVLVQFIESNVVTPIIQRRMVSLPPVVTLFAILCFGLLFGPLGLLFATPLAVFIFVVVNNLYVRGLLEESVEVPGEKEVLKEKLEEARA